jgi:hypothetical protein
MTSRTLQRRVEQLEKTIEETVPRSELNEFLARLTAVALTYMTPDSAEAALDEILAGASPAAQLAFLDQIRAALRQ